ncbi:NDP-sugar epimerase, includes UDP-GlcNAc-inverting 4,6-dehydratase FlaA1 and capsular polysaccharide biosynthesis protein EpsC [Halanaeroarchaeum sp. HSR-CO]|uniref:polysaccharide biosynthesis protein n=1 Tax=Halanaeroarchaeum sp. HSR-CO TaxID=2866382 RepID=UPI00217D5DA4|nr:polysaccharide biosynthesis protein [Halanaeroarchaeum sp. HSR-CO]UWG48115.1 NDP-sugar epimerase, includes UDP-GlcNAc-inverting 4,6-dehydratase FlaA1 and capsular polysaccharide biosynthesis protein EpsC [Halanaeroarchaeum sp. HSR-CO]
MTSLAGKDVLVTGGCGSIGSHLVEEILKQDPSVVRVLDNNEEGLFELQNELGEDNSVRYLLGDVRDQDRLELAMENIDVVFHAAALKHVSINEYNPFETVQTNVQGTQNLIRAALETEVGSFVTVSTDKSSNPTSVMGATKLLSERLTIAANAYKGDRETKFGCVRFGNVLGSSGSVVPLFLQQIKDGGPVTVTNPEMTRFIMPIEEASALVLEAHERMTSGEVFVLKMPSFEVGTLADGMVEEYAPRIGQSPEEIDIEIMGSRPGERMHEKLVSVDESVQARELDDMYVILPQIDVPGYDSVNYADAELVDDEYTSKDAQRLSKNELIDLIESASLDVEMPDMVC